MEPELYPHQQRAISKMKNGSILCGGVGTGKSITSLGFYYYKVSKKACDKPLYIITTAHKRDSGEWELECARWGIPFEHDTPLVIDSWNNIEKYKEVTNAFFIFDEHKAIGSGKWAKTFIRIAKRNGWILLTATPGDTWMDYVSVFVANGFYKNRTEFINRHVIINPYVQYFSVKSYTNVSELIRNRDYILVEMPYIKPATKEEIIVPCDFDKQLYDSTMKNRWNPFEEEPIENASELCYILRKICNSHESRIENILKIIEKTKKSIIFYNYDYELEILKKNIKCTITEWNGHRHDTISKDDSWVHLVQYNAGAEGWNCIETNCIIFYSQSYSYKMTEQAKGRIDRLNTPFKTLYYYILKSESDIDKAISRALNDKKEFNANTYLKGVVFT